MNDTRTALVIGGGIAGPAAAIALQKAGIAATVYESHPEGAGGVGAFLTLGVNGIDALRVLGAAARLDDVGFPTPGILLRNAGGRSLGESSTGQALADGTVSQTLSRADLYQVMHDEAAARGIRIEHGKRLVAAVESDDGVCATFDDGTTARGDLLVGADGLYSTVRTIIDPGAPAPVYSGLITTGGYADGIHAGADTARPGSYEMIFGRRAFFGYAAAPDGVVWWFANVPHQPEPARGELARMPLAEWRRRLLELYAGDAGPAIATIEATRTLMPMTAIHSIPHLPTWHSARMVVIGDAAHAPSPTSGQGASLSIEDAIVLAKCLRDVPGTTAALARFEAERRPRVERIIKAAARINNSKAAGPVARVIRDAMLPTVLKLGANTRAMRETYGFHVDWAKAGH